MPNHPNESQFEETTIERLKLLGYRYLHGNDIDRPLHTVVLTDRLLANLRQRYPDLPEAVLAQAVQIFSAPAGVTLERRNLAFQQLLRQGTILHYEQDGREQSAHLYPVDFSAHGLEQNEFLVVNQFSVQQSATGGNTRRPDLLIFINGLPLVLFELKSPWDAYADVVGAHNQIGHYTVDIPQLFTFNSFCVVSDGNTTLHGMYNAGFEWYAPWKSIDGQTVEPNTTGSMKTLIEGLFQREHLLDYLQNFIVHEIVNERIIKKGAKYHQFFAVRLAVQPALQAMQPAADRRVGVIWHTQGSGKSLSMIFLVGILRRWPGLNPSIVVQVDRTDLDKQLYDSFVAASELVGTVHQASTVAELRTMLQTEGGAVICSTIEKFRLRADETSHPLLSERTNILVIADEAHRTQYGLTEGFAGHLRQALPNAAFIGFTGTPIDKTDANTIQIFGDYIHTYDMQQARADHAVVGLFYEARHIPLAQGDTQLDTRLDDLVQEHAEDLTPEELDYGKGRWSLLEWAAGTEERIAHLAQDLLAHFTVRQEALAGKAMVVCMNRAICVRLYEALTALPGCPEIRVVMTGNLAEDPPAWSAAGHITTKKQREAIKERFINPDDPLKLVIVCDMWLTGFDAPCVNTLYVDKKMRGHTLMQAIARVNRVFRDKPGGLIVDYINIGDELKEATQKYTTGGGQGQLTVDLEQQAVQLFLEHLAATRTCLPANQPYARWRSLSKIELEDLCNRCYGTLASHAGQRDDFLTAEYRLSQAFSLVSHLDTGKTHLDEVAFYQMVRKQVRKLQPQARQDRRDLDRAVQELLDESISAQPSVDIFAVAGLETPDVSILDEQFLAGFAQHKNQDLQARLLATLMQDEFHRRQRQNVTRYRSFQQLLDETLTRYNNGFIQAADVVATIHQMRQQQQADDQRAADLSLTAEELAFYDVIVQGDSQGITTDNAWIADLVREVVAAVKRNVKVDWTKAHRQDVYASVQSAVSRVLRQRGIKGEQFTFLRNRLMEQASASYADWPLVA